MFSCELRLTEASERAIHLATTTLHNVGLNTVNPLH